MPSERPTSCPSESAEQQILVRVLRKCGVGCFSVPNGAILGGRNKFGLLGKLKAEGMLPGAPDLILADLDGKGRPIAVEMKRKKGGVVSDDQRKVMGQLAACGWAVVLARGTSDALIQLKKLGVERLQTVNLDVIRLV